MDFDPGVEKNPIASSLTVVSSNFKSSLGRQTKLVRTILQNLNYDISENFATETSNDKQIKKRLT